MKTIEEELLTALLKANFITEEAFNTPQMIQFQRAARTDKGVSAVRQVVSIKLREYTEYINIPCYKAFSVIVARKRPLCSLLFLQLKM